MTGAEAPRGLLVVANEAAGRASEDALEIGLALLRGRTEVRVALLSSIEELASVLGSRGPGERLVIAGGDGSAHAVVQALSDAAALTPRDPVGLLPLGTGNDLARCLGVPLDAEAAATAVLDGRPRRLDLLVDDEGGIGVNAVHVGIGAEAAVAAEQWKERMGQTGYAVGGALAGVREEGWRLRVEVDGAPLVDGSARVLMVGLGIGTTIGGGAPLTPDALPDDGLVDVVVSRATGPLARVGYALDLRSGEHIDRDDVLTARGRVVAVSGEPFRANTDGEVLGPFTTRRWEVHPGAWSVVVPAASG